MVRPTTTYQSSPSREQLLRSLAAVLRDIAARAAAEASARTTSAPSGDERDQ
jgi:hypothetical protein